MLWAIMVSPLLQQESWLPDRLVGLKKQPLFVKALSLGVVLVLASPWFDTIVFNKNLSKEFQKRFIGSHLTGRWSKIVILASSENVI